MLLAGILCACDDRRQKSELPVIPTTPAENGPSYELDLQPLTPLTPNRTTHVAADPLGNICWLQETESADDTVFIMGEGQIPRVSDLTTSRVADTINGGRGATGRIQSIAAGRGGEIYFYFIGRSGKRLIAALGLYTPKNSRIRILADADALKDASGLGASVALARGTLYSNNACVWLWLRHSDDSALFRLRHTDIPAAGSPRLAESLMSVTIQDQKVSLTDDDYNFAPAGDDTLFWMDTDESELRQIDGLGRVKTVRSLIGLPVALSAPVRGDQGKLLMFAGDAPIMEAQHIGQVDAQRVRLNVKYPAMLMFAGGGAPGQPVRAVGADSFVIYSGFPLSTMRIRNLIPEAKGGTWIAYDPSSGELLRLRLREKASPMP